MLALHSHRATLVVGIVLIGTPLALAQPARFHDVELLVTHADFDALPSDYSLSVFLSGHSNAAGAITDYRLVAPSGTVFRESTTTVRRSSLASIAATMIGTWTAFETLDGVETSYQFLVAPTTLEGVPTGLPLITSPATGATVGSTFEVHWSFDNSLAPATVAFQFFPSADLQVEGISLVPGTTNTLRFDTKLLAPGPQPFDELQIIQGFQLPAPTLAKSAPELAGDQFEFAARFEAISNAISLNVIPEPSGVALTFCVAILLADRVRRVRRT